MALLLNLSKGEVYPDALGLNGSELSLLMSGHLVFQLDTVYSHDLVIHLPTLPIRDTGLSLPWTTDQSILHQRGVPMHHYTLFGECYVLGTGQVGPLFYLEYVTALPKRDRLASHGIPTEHGLIIEFKLHALIQRIPLYSGLLVLNSSLCLRQRHPLVFDLYLYFSEYLYDDAFDQTHHDGVD